LVADIRDAARLREIFAAHRPDVVFHAAALKHLTLLELHPGEAVKTNIWATQSLLEISAAFSVGRFINISTDKAANPISVLGYSKRIAERLTCAMAKDTNRPFLSVRFGNVLGSRGSVVPTFRAQIDVGGPVTVTHPETTRFFMVVEEAVQLVMQAGAIGEPGEVLVLDMGEPIRIVDIAQQLITASGRDIDIVFTGLRPGEKLHENLMDSDETNLRPRHSMVMHTRALPLEPAKAMAIDLSSRSLVTELSLLCADVGEPTICSVSPSSVRS
jgi:dTDP-glucose 4,6-dehydratase